MKQATAIILGTSGGQRFLDGSKSIPSTLAVVESNQSVLSWIQKALKSQGISESAYIGGYHIQKVIENFPGLSYVFHSEWQKEGELGGLRHVRCDKSRDYLIIRGNIVLTSEAIDCLFKTPGILVTGACSSTTKSPRIDVLLVRSEFVRQFFDQVERLYSNDKLLGLEGLIETLNEVVHVDISGKAAAVENRPDVMRLVFKGKARTLEQLKELTTRGIVLGQIRFSVEDWRSNQASIIHAIQEDLDAEFFAVRSSSQSEDLVGSTGAGQFESVLGVPASDFAKISLAIDRVIESYGRDSREICATDEVLVQPQIIDVASSGVVFTRDLETHAPSFTVTIDYESKRTDVITSGSEGVIDTYFVSWNAEEKKLPVDIGRVIELSKELMGLTHLDALDIEFSFDTGGNLYLFQVRPLPQPDNTFTLSDQDLLDAVLAAKSFVEQNANPHPLLSGDTTLFGNMPDWNPAEMIGRAPRPLSLSLYQTLIGDFHWAQARAEIGYRDVTPEPLVVSISGKPYIDVRASLNSFLPAGLSSTTSEKWINDCLSRLAANPELHDKLEFEILPSCFAFDWDLHVQRMIEAGLSSGEIEDYRALLSNLTSEVLAGNVLPAKEMLRDVDRLELMRQKRLQDGANTAPAFARRVHLLLVDCGRFGLKPFSVLARYAFIALSVLKSLVSKGVLSTNEMELFLQSIPTVAGEFTDDLAEYLSGHFSETKFLEKYGHLRPNSYEITSANYAEAFERYIKSGAITDWTSKVSVSDAERLIENRAEEIDKVLDEYGLRINSHQLFSFMRSAIAGREKAKFEFMKSVNSVLDAVRLFGNEIGLTRDQLSHLHIDEILQFAKSSMNGSTVSHLKRLASFKQKQMEVTRAIKMPDLIRHPDDVSCYKQEVWKPNFVTQHCLQADVVDLSNEADEIDLKGKIVLIQAADPGYDWIFGHKIAGLLTEYGGVGSHMAIRAAEFSLPAAIGCGSVIFEKMRKASRIELDCANETISKLAQAKVENA